MTNLKTQDIKNFQKYYKAHDAMMSAIEQNDLKHVKKLLNAKLKIPFQKGSFLKYAAEKGHLEIVQCLINTGEVDLNRDVALMFAAKFGQLDVVKYLIELGADIHSHYDVSLQWAAEGGHLEVVKCLMDNGADIHAKFDQALRWAAERGHLGVVQYNKTLHGL